MSEPVAPRGERWQRADRLHRSRDFLRCYRRGRKLSGRWLALYCSPAGGARARLGVTAGRKTGGAIVRHRLKRWVREIFRRSSRRASLAGWDIVAHVKPEASQVRFRELREEIERLLGVIAERSPRSSGGGGRRPGA